MRIVLRVLLSPGCINLKNLCAHLQEEVLTIPKHPLLAQFDESEAKLWCSKEDRFFLKYFWYSILVATLFFAVFSANTHQKDDFWGCFGNLRISSWWWAQRFWKLMQKWLRKLKLKLATPIWKLTEKHDWWCMWFSKIMAPSVCSRQSQHNITTTMTCIDNFLHQCVALKGQQILEQIQRRFPGALQERY